MKNAAVIFFVFAVAAFGCSKKNVPAAEIYGFDYYPTTQNKFVVYDIDSVIYTEIPKDTVSYRYRVKEKVADSFSDNEGKPAIRMERYIKKFDAAKPYDSIAWTIKEVWMVTANQKSIQVLEGNVRFTKLIFPVQEKAMWNGNVSNTLGDASYTYDYIDRQETIGDKSLENVLLVKQKEFRTLISYESASEKYAKGIGLVYREITNILSNNIVPGTPVENRIESGMIYKQTLVTYGYE